MEKPAQRPDELLNQAAELRDQGFGEQAAQLATTAANALSQEREPLAAARAWHEAGISYKVAGNPTEAIAAYERALPLYQQANEPFGPGRIQRDIGLALYDEANLPGALEQFTASVALLRAIPTDTDDTARFKASELGISLAKKGMVLQKMGRHEEASAVIQDGLTQIRLGGNTAYETTALFHLAEVEMESGNAAIARAHIVDGMAIITKTKQETRHSRRLAEGYLALARCDLALHNKELAKTNLQKGQALLAPLSENARSVIEHQLGVAELSAQLAD